MRRHLILTLSVGMNAVLLAVWLTARRSSHQLQAQPTSPQPAVSNVYRTHVVVRKQFFSWQELESPDYQAYVTNLRAIGCPEQTIRDIILADVNQLYAKRRDTEVVTPGQQWWRYNPDPAVVKASNAKLAAMEQERKDLLTTLLGPDWTAAERITSTGVSLDGPLLGDLSPETKHSVQEAVLRSQQLTQAYLNTQKAAGKPADPVEVGQLGQQLRAELAQVLNPAQLEEFLLRYSQSAAALRERLRGVEVTPDEFRALWHVADPLDQKVEVAGDVPSVGVQSDANNQLEQALKNVLGADRYQAYRTTQEAAYQDALATADDSGGATPGQIRALYEVNKATQQERERIKNDNTLTPEQKSAQLATVEKQQQAASDQILGFEADTPPQPPPPPTPFRIYRYSASESVDMIAAKYGVSRSDILTANPTLNFNALTPGTPIRIPQPVSQQ